MGYRKRDGLMFFGGRLREASVFTALVVAMLVVMLVVQGPVREAGAQDDEPTFGGPDRPGFEAGKILVKLEEDATRADLRELNRENAARTEEILSEGDVSVVDLPEDLTVREAVEVYEDSPAVEYAEPNYFVYPTRTEPDDSLFSQMYGLDNTGQTRGTPDADIDAPEAWDTQTGDPGTLVAVIDTGVDVNHPDLRENIWVNEDEIPDNGIDDDRNGFVDDVHGWDFLNDDASVYDPDLLTGKGEEHGTHVAGTIAASGNNATGVTGVNWRADVMVLKFLGPNGGKQSDAIKAIDYAVNNGARISNNSWGCSGCFNQALKDAISRADAAGHLFVAAAGNGGSDSVGDDNDSKPQYPSSYDNPNIISVAATDHNDDLTSFSNFGSTSVDLGAPGSRILSTLPDESYGYFNGTSMAAPHVAGVAALIKSQSPALDDAQIKARILGSADAKAGLSNRTVTGGRLNAARALGMTLATSLSLDANPLSPTFGQATTLSGRLTSGGGPLGGRTIVLEQRPLGAADFSRLGETTTAADGSFGLAGVRPDRHTDYRARFEGSGADQLGPSASAVRRVNVKVSVTLSTATTTLKAGRARSISGLVRPVHGGAVTVTIKRDGAVISRRKVALGDTGKYGFVYRPQRPGKYAFFATYPGDADHLGNRSPQRSFRVVR